MTRICFLWIATLTSCARNDAAVRIVSAFSKSCNDAVVVSVSLKADLSKLCLYLASLVLVFCKCAELFFDFFKSTFKPCYNAFVNFKRRKWDFERFNSTFGDIWLRSTISPFVNFSLQSI